MPRPHPDPACPFWVFGGEFAAEPNGGMRDLLDAFPTRPEADAYARGYMAGRGGEGWTGWAQVYDSLSGDSADVGA